MTRSFVTRKKRRGTVSLEVVASIGVTFVVAFAGFQIAVKGYRALYTLISLWLGSPFY